MVALPPSLTLSVLRCVPAAAPRGQWRGCCRLLQWAERRPGSAAVFPGLGPPLWLAPAALGPLRCASRHALGVARPPARTHARRPPTRQLEQTALLLPCSTLDPAPCPLPPAPPPAPHPARLHEQQVWAAEQVAEHADAGDEAEGAAGFWRLLGLLMRQFDGMTDGYQARAAAAKQAGGDAEAAVGWLSRAELSFLNNNGAGGGRPSLAYCLSRLLRPPRGRPRCPSLLDTLPCPNTRSSTTSPCR